MKILVIRFSSAGDIVCMTLALRRLRERFPEATIEMVTKAGFAGLLRTNTVIDRLRTISDQASLREALSMAWSLRAERFDVVIDLHSSLRSRVITSFLVGSRHLRLRKSPLRRVGPVADDSGIPIPLRYLQVLEPLGVDQQNGRLEFPVVGVEPVRSVLSEIGYLVVAPGARHATKRWSPERFAASAARTADAAGCRGIVLIGGGDAKGEVRETIQHLSALGTDLQIVDLCGECDWEQTARTIADAEILLTNDSVAGHLAAAVGTPVVSIFGSTVPAFGFVPHADAVEVVEVEGLSCRPCTRIGRHICPEGHFRCMKEIDATHVSDAAEKLLLRTAKDQS